MKVEKTNQFVPITITIETAEEAEELWHRLNVNGGALREVYSCIYYQPNKCADQMWEALDAVFHPPEY